MMKGSSYTCHTEHQTGMQSDGRFHHLLGCTSLFPVTPHLHVVFREMWKVCACVFECLIFRVIPSISSLYLKLLSIHLCWNVLNTDMLAVSYFDRLPACVIKLSNVSCFIVYSMQSITTLPVCCLMICSLHVVQKWLLSQLTNQRGVFFHKMLHILRHYHKDASGSLSGEELKS